MTALNYLMQFQKSDLILSHEGLGNTCVIGIVRTVVSASLVLAGCHFQASDVEEIQAEVTRSLDILWKTLVFGYQTKAESQPKKQLLQGSCDRVSVRCWMDGTRLMSSGQPQSPGL